MAFTYDPTSTIGRIRLLISDTDSKDFMFSDEELSAFLSMEEDNLYLAAAAAFGTIMRSRALLSKSIQREGYSSSEHALSELREIVKDLEQKAVSQGGIQTTEFATSGEIFEAYRPGWRSENDEVTE